MKDLVLSGAGFQDLTTSILNSAPNRRVRVPCRGYSMTPFIRNNDLVTLKPVDPVRGVKFGDIVAVSLSDSQRILIHRVIRQRNGRIQTKGDNNSMADTWCPIRQVIGMVDDISGRWCLPLPLLKLQHMAVAVASRTGIWNRLIVPCAHCLRKILK